MMPYQPDCHYLWSTVMRDRDTSSYDPRSGVLTITTHPINGTVYRAVFQEVGPAPYSGITIRCTSIQEVESQ